VAASIARGQNGDGYHHRRDHRRHHYVSGPRQSYQHYATSRRHPVGRIRLVVAIALFYFTYDIVPPIFLVFFSAAVVALAISRIPTYFITAPGTLPNPEKKEPNQPPEPTR
jgi:hypothetical protein